MRIAMLENHVARILFSVALRLGRKKNSTCVHTVGLFKRYFPEYGGKLSKPTGAIKNNNIPFANCCLPANFKTGRTFFQLHGSRIGLTLCGVAANRMLTKRYSSTHTSAPRCAVQEGSCIRYTALGEDREIEARVGRMLGAGSFATVWELSSEGSIAVLKCFQEPEAVIACLFGQDFLQEVQEQSLREIRVGERLCNGPTRHGRAYIALMLSKRVQIVTDLGVQEPRQPLLVYEHAGIGLEGSAAASLSLKDKFSLVGGLLQAISYLSLLNIVHADVNLGNVCINEDKHPRLMDFGNAVLFDTRSRTMPCKRLEKIHMAYVHQKGFPPAERYAHSLKLRDLIDNIERPRNINVYKKRYDPDLLAGNLAATPPEAFRGILVPGSSDLYGLGILLWQLLTDSETPFEIEFECERVYFEGWAQFYSMPQRARRSYLRKELESNLLDCHCGDLKGDVFDAVVEWLLFALAEAPEERSEAFHFALCDTAQT